MGIYDDLLASPSAEAPPSQSVPRQSATTGNAYADMLAAPPPELAAPEGKVVARSAFFPFSKLDTGQTKFDWGSGITGSLGSALTLPGRVASGEVQMPQPGAREPGSYNQVIPEVVNMGMSFGPMVNPMVRSGDRAIAGVGTNLQRPIRAAPTASELAKVGGAQMDAFYDLPIRYNPQHMGSLASGIENRLVKEGVFPEDAPGIYKTLSRMQRSAAQQAPGDTVIIAPASLHSLRKNIANKFGVQGEDQLAPKIAQEELDKFIKTPPEGAVLGGPGGQTTGKIAGQLFSDAKGNLAASYRGKDIADLTKEIDLRTAAAHSGKNLDNTTRAKITNFLLDEKASRGFTTAEKGALEGAVYGDPWTNRARTVSKVLGGGGGLGAGLSGAAGATVGGTIGMALGVPPFVSYPVGAAVPPAVGNLLGRWGAGRTTNAMLDVAEAARRRSPLFQEQPLLPMQAPPPTGRAAITRSLMMETRPPPEELPILEYDPNRV
jgi:hypothetical protein